MLLGGFHCAPGRLTGKNEGSRISCDAEFSYPNKNVANKGGRFKRFLVQTSIVAPSCTDADTDTASDNDTAVLDAVTEGCDAKAMHDQQVIPPRPKGSQLFNYEVMSWYGQYGTDKS